MAPGLHGTKVSEQHITWLPQKEDVMFMLYPMTLTQAACHNAKDFFLLVRCNTAPEILIWAAV